MTSTRILTIASVLLLLAPSDEAAPRSDDEVVLLPGPDSNSRYASWDGSGRLLRVELVQGARLVVEDALRVHLPEGPGTVTIDSGPLPDGIARFRWVLYEGDVETASLEVGREWVERAHVVSGAPGPLSLGFEAEAGEDLGTSGALRLSVSFSRQV